MASDLAKLIELAKQAGLEGEDLNKFLRDERSAQREAERLAFEAKERDKVREEKEKEREEKEKEREEKEKERK